ncbi:MULTISPECIES: AMP-binding protein [unclassified Massilia]|uniref:AMP-binding protein n=1 Tax=unclassified Massilia TaxID=2609279 RepID=UPI0017866660|nr:MULTISPECIES: AMP-binding protein [unclassified Massilia]MBD8530071.1 AMP-binding protein [Massilia sp. CFBP 13647]MBD8674100.1 AMP-binding protein [Massilia sp. CFBP 13721]
MTPYQRFVQARDFLQQHRTDYETAYRDYRAPKLDTFNWALDFFDQEARDNHAPALWVVEEDGREQKISFADMAARSNQVAQYLQQCGVERGDRVLLMLPNRVELWEIMLAGIKLGAVLVPTTMLVSTADLQDRMERGRVRHVIVQVSDAHKFEGVSGNYTRIAVGGSIDGWHDFDDCRRVLSVFTPKGETRASDPLLLYFTSGTTAQPKLVLHSQQSYPVGHLSTMYWIGLQKGDVHWNISSPGWAKHAWSCFFAPWNAGATVFVYNYERFSAKAALATVQRCGVTSLCAPPTVWRMLIKEDLAQWQPPLRELVGAGEPLNPEVIEQVERAWGIRIRDGFGQSETTAQIGNPPGQLVKPGSMGRPLPGYAIALLDIDDAPAQEGEISVKLDPAPLGLMLAYEGDEAKTAGVMRAGFYHTGDTAHIDADGYYFYVGRNDDVFKSSDYRISPFELESVLVEHEMVLEAAIVPSPDALRLSVPKAFITLRQGVEPSRELAREIFAFARERLAPYKRIRRIEFRELPKTISGKIRRVELRKQEAVRDTAPGTGVEFREEDLGG